MLMGIQYIKMYVINTINRGWSCEGVQFLYIIEVVFIHLK